MRRKVFWVRTEPPRRFDAVPPYETLPGLVLGSLSILFIWLMGAQHFTHHCRFPSSGSCPIIPPHPGGLLSPIQEGTAEPQSHRGAVKICTSWGCK